MTTANATFPLPGPQTPEALAGALVGWLPNDTDLVVPIANGEPVALLDAIEDRATQLREVRLHQMHALRPRRHIDGDFAGHLEHVAWFLSAVTRPALERGACSFTPANFSEIPQLLLEKGPAVVLAAASPPDRHGFFSLGVSADYSAALIGKVPFVLEVNPSMPRTHGENRIHMRDVLAWCEHDTALVEVPPREPSTVDRRIAELVAERIPHHATIQLGIGAIPAAIAGGLADHRDLGVHTELLSDPIVDLVEAGVVTGVHKRTNPRRVTTTFALGSQRLYDFCHENDLVQFLPVDVVNDPRRIGQEPNFVSVNATIEVDLLGQCASETIGTRYWSGSGGQADFARGAQYSDGGDGFVVCRATAKDGTVSRIRPTLSPGTVVTTMKNTVDNVVTEFGVAELRGRTLEQRARALIGIADPRFRDELEREARASGLLRAT